MANKALQLPPADRGHNSHRRTFIKRSTSRLHRRASKRYVLTAIHLADLSQLPEPAAYFDGYSD